MAYVRYDRPASDAYVDSYRATSFSFARAKMLIGCDSPQSGTPQAETHRERMNDVSQQESMGCGGCTNGDGMQM